MEEKYSDMKSNYSKQDSRANSIEKMSQKGKYVTKANYKVNITDA